jgi:hypothetical protein
MASAAVSGSTAHRTPRGAIIKAAVLFAYFVTNLIQNNAKKWKNYPCQIGANSCATVQLHW